MSVSNLFLWMILLAAAVVVDLVFFPRFLRTPTGEKIESFFTNSPIFKSEPEASEPAVQSLPGRLDAIDKARAWFKRKTESRAAQRDALQIPQVVVSTGSIPTVESPHQINIVADSITQVPVSVLPGQTHTLVVSSESITPEQAPADLPDIEPPAPLENPGILPDPVNANPTQPKSHIQIDVSLAPGETVRITVESKPKK